MNRNIISSDEFSEILTDTYSEFVDILGAAVESCGLSEKSSHCKNIERIVRRYSLRLARRLFGNGGVPEALELDELQNL